MKKAKQASKKVKAPEQPVCEVCDDRVVDVRDLTGCDRCGRMFGPCCNSEQDDVCVECA